MNARHARYPGRTPAVGLWLSALVAVALFMPACAGAPEQRLPPGLAEARHLASQGSAWYDRGCLTLAERYFYQALEASRLVDDLEGMVRARNNLAAVALAQGYYEEAAEHLQQALELNAQVDGTGELSLMLGNLGSLAYETGRSQEAENLWRQALTAAEEDPQRSGLILHLNHLGMLLRIQGRLDEADSLLRRALAVAEEQGRESAANTHLQLGLLAQRRGDLAQAEKHLNLALEKDRAEENSLGIAQDLEKLGAFHQRQGLWQQAARELDRAIRLYADLGRVDKAAEVFELMKLNRTRGGVPESLEEYQGLLVPPGEFWESPLCR